MKLMGGGGYFLRYVVNRRIHGRTHKVIARNPWRGLMTILRFSGFFDIYELSRNRFRAIVIQMRHTKWAYSIHCSIEDYGVNSNKPGNDLLSDIS